MANKKDHDSLRPHSSVPGEAARRALRLAAAPLARAARMFGGGVMAPAAFPRSRFPSR